MMKKLVNSTQIKVLDGLPEPKFSIRNNLGSGSTFVNYYVADGFPEDCDRLLRRYLKHKVISYEVFRDIFREMQFHKIYKAVSNKGEAAELSEEVLVIAKQHMVQAKTFEHSVAGMFLLYSLVHTQPFKRFAFVRFIPSDVPALIRIVTEARAKKYFDVLYIIGSLLIEGPTEFNIGNRDYGLERQYRKHFENKISTNGETMSFGVLKKDCEEKEALRSLSLAVRKYNDAKSKIPQYEQFEVNHYIDSDLPEQLYAELLVLLRKDCEATPPNELYRNRKSVKLRALKNLVNEAPYLVSVKDTVKDAEVNMLKEKEEMLEQEKGSVASVNTDAAVRDAKRPGKSEATPKGKGKGGKTKNRKGRTHVKTYTDIPATDTDTPETDIIIRETEDVTLKLEACETVNDVTFENTGERGMKRSHQGNVIEVEVGGGGKETQAAWSFNMPDLSDTGRSGAVDRDVMENINKTSSLTITELFGDDIKSDDEDDMNSEDLKK